MSVVSLKQEVSQIRSEADLNPDHPEDHLKKLFDLFRQIEASLSNCTGDDAASEEKRSGLIDAQTVVMRTASVLPARSMSDLLYKLALWRWDAADLDQPLETMSRKNAIAYSAFRDLAKMLGDDTILTDFDKTH
ncbi:MAG: hypothetical protein KAH44_21500 [Oricola sp.]|jgi:hypothetical protein|nr:hypothetical protein [Oricola sp.]